MLLKKLGELEKFEKIEKLEELKKLLKKFGYAHILTTKYRIFVQIFDSGVVETVTVTTKNFPIGNGCYSDLNNFLNQLHYFGKILEVKV